MKRAHEVSRENLQKASKKGRAEGQRRICRKTIATVLHLPQPSRRKK
jgi:hypothetical protein